MISDQKIKCESFQRINKEKDIEADQKLEISKKSTFRLNLVPPRDSSIGDIFHVTVDEI